ncbi:MAG: 3-methyl-2-oxobutanoate hydroxymethyltransferase [Verrucomicrobia bacterium]|nr:MAG: 3-methyl-2-oxobutanoate hydroxymethyltransferase [Verrucomicrobiota bacterium]
MNSTAPWTAARLRALKGREKIVSLTAYDFATARLVDESGIHLVLVGDSLGMTVLGYENTLPVTMLDMLHHTAAVARGVQNALVVADMPFMSYQISVPHALCNAARFLKVGAHAVKIEGGALRVPTVRALVENGIPVLGHIGLTPQSVQEFGGFKVQGRTEAAAEELLRDARALEEAGVFAIVLESIPPDLAGKITAAVGVPTIGIGAGPQCDGQVLVIHDLLGLGGDWKPKFAKRYADLGTAARAAISDYKREVETGKFPGPEHCY